MAGILEWFRRRPRKNSLAGTTAPLAVETLEPRQMLAADAFMLVELGSATGTPDDRFIEWGPHAAGCDFSPRGGEASRSRLQIALDHQPFVYLQDVVDEIGELFEIDDPDEMEWEPDDFSWFS